MLAARNMTIERNGRRLVDSVTLALAPASVTAVIGPNGAGKSTLLKALAGEIRPSTGEATLDGRALSDFAAAALARRRAVLPQASRLSFPFTVAEVVSLAFAVGVRGSRAARDDAVRAALSEVEMEALAGRLYQQLSGGEQQRVQLARVLCQISAASDDGPRYLLLDEPTAALDIAHQIAACRLLRQRADRGFGVFIVLHDINLASSTADRLIMLRAGRIVSEGPPEEILTPRAIEDVYGVPLRVLALSGSSIPVVLPEIITDAP